MEGNPGRESKENSRISFRKATPADAEAFVELERMVAGHKTYSGILNTDEALEEFRDNEVYLFYKGERLVGSTEFQMKSPDHAYIAGLVVHPEFQGTRVAYEAIQLLSEKLKEVKEVEFVTHPENAKVLSMCKSFGFKVKERVENYYGDGEPRLVLVKEN